MYCVECLKQGVHKHFNHTDALKFTEGTAKRWTELKESIEETINAANESFGRQAPLVRYLEQETRIS